MPHSACRPLAAVLMLLSGCASPLFSGLSSRSHPDSAPAGQKIVGLSDAARGTRSANAADGKLSDYRAADRETSPAGRQIRDLLAAAARKQVWGRIAEAKIDYDHVLRLDPQNMTANYQMAVMADDEHRYGDAERHYFVMLKQSPRNPDILASLGWSYLLSERFDDSDRVLQEALQYAPTHQTALYNLGWLYGTRGNYERALAIFRSAGSEADAQRALAELKQTPRPTQVAGALPNNGTIRDSRLPIDSGAPSAAIRTVGNERQSSPKISAPAPWNDGRMPVGDSRPRSQTGGVFPEADAYASSSPTLANQARQADPQNFDDFADFGSSGFPPPRSRSGQPVIYEQSAPLTPGRPNSPVITPAAAGAGMNGRRPGATAWNAQPPVNSLASQAGLTSPPVAGRDAERSSNNAGNAGLPDWSGAVAADRTGTAIPADGVTHAGHRSLSRAQLTAAQLGLAAGAGGLNFVIEDGSDSLPRSEMTDSPQVVEQAGASGGPRQQSLESGVVPTGTTAVYRMPVVERQASSSQPSAAPTRGLPPWPGRSNLAAPIPTEVAPSVGF